MYHGWYTGRNAIRTRGAGIRIRISGEGFQGETLVSLAIIGDDVQMIIKNIDRIDERFNYMATEQGIVPVAFCKPVKEEQNTITVQKLGL